MAPRTRFLIFISAILIIAAPVPGACQIDDARSSGQKSVGTAMGLSLLGTALPLFSKDPALVGAGLIVGPNLGDVYLGDSGRALRGSLLRAGVMGVTSGLIVAICSAGCDIGLFGGSSDPGFGAAVMVGLIGATTTVVLAGREIRDLPGRVHARNARDIPRVTLHPTVDPGGRRAGLRLEIRY